MLDGAMPKAGKSTVGKNAVTPIGKHSLKRKQILK